MKTVKNINMWLLPYEKEPHIGKKKVPTGRKKLLQALKQLLQGLQHMFQSLQQKTQGEVRTFSSLASHIHPNGW